MVKISEDTFKLVKSNYGEEHPNESFVDDVLCNIVDDDNYYLGNILLPYCDDENVKSFWKKNLNKDNYVHLFPYIVLELWQNQNSESEFLNSWIESYEKEFKSFLIDEIGFFLENFRDDLLPPNYVVEIGYIIDSFQWLKLKLCPTFTTYACNKKLFTDDLYGKYVLLFVNSLEGYSQDTMLCTIQTLLKYASTTDIIVHKKECFIAIVERLSNVGKRDAELSEILMSIPQNRCNLDTYKEVIAFYLKNYNVYKDRTCFSFCRHYGEEDFWRNNVSAYNYVALYVALKEWNDDYNVVELKYWLGMFSSGEISVLLEREMKTLIKQISDDTNNVPKSITEKIGFIIEAYFWERYYKIPSLLKSIVFSSDYVDKYQRLLLDDANHKSKNDFQVLIERIDSYLQFCLVLDSNASFMKSNFLIFLELTCNNESDKLVSILALYPYYGDEYGLTLLKYCIDNAKLYKLSNKDIDKYNFRLSVDSWLTEIKRKLGNNSVPYNSELCKQTCSHNKIVEVINSKQSALWDELCKMTIDVVDDVRIENPSGKRIPVRNTVYSKTKEICTNSKKEIFSSLHNLLIDAKKEGISLFIDMCKEYALKNGKKIALTQKVINTINDYLVEHYIDETIPSYSMDFEKGYGFADRVAREWVNYWMLASDDMMEKISENQLNRIRDSFNTFVWEPMKDELIQLCTNFYGYATWDFDSSTSNYNSSYGDNYSSDYDNDDYGIYSGGAFM